MNLPHINAIIQARTGSRRLPRKVLARIAGKPLLQRVIERVKGSRYIKEIIVATTTKEEDGAVISIAKKSKVTWFLGSEKDVLDRYYHAALAYGGDPIVRITGDCPLIDPRIIDETIAFYLKQKGAIEYTSTPHLYPEGNDTEVFSFRALKEAWEKARKPSEREHVTPYIKEHVAAKLLEKEGEDYSWMHWSVDEKRDLLFVQRIYRYLSPARPHFSAKDIIDILKKHPELLEINRGLTGYEGYTQSLKEDALWGAHTHHSR